MIVLGSSDWICHYCASHHLLLGGCQGPDWTGACSTEPGGGGGRTFDAVRRRRVAMGVRVVSVSRVRGVGVLSI